MTYRAVSVVGFGEASFTPGFETTTGAGAGVAVVTGGGAGGVTMIPALQLVSERTRKRSKKLTIDRAPVKQWVRVRLPRRGRALDWGLVRVVLVVRERELKWACDWNLWTRS
jgi:Na+-driven multidrug efflux pump